MTVRSKDQILILLLTIANFRQLHYFNFLSFIFLSYKDGIKILTLLDYYEAQMR